ncbi:ankyrin repeat domain-containing protein [Fulvivirga sediminis]|uniref:Ankyrin repeat domain-containing protein n=1 Tax=Fulvivirga sediminis TaxID=2803949 RepID=A0A937FDB4_9BACT|nr:ankyrin repeat domain-containing protein [Fulvivirga sediminis]MBL3658815.1 ankyrin repeat domain-containing protein [Fulvivirga sediminis]
MKIRIIIFFMAWVSISCETKVDTQSIATVIEKDDLNKFQQFVSKINLDTCVFSMDENALHYAIRMGSRKIASRLIDEEFMLNATDSLKFTPLLLSAMLNYKDITDKLLEKDISIDNIEEYNDLAALHYAVYNNDLSLAKKLIARNANVNIKCNSRIASTPLHFAIESENGLMAKLLLDNNASDTIQDGNDHTAIDLASETSNPDILKLFYKKMGVDKKKELFFNITRGSGDLAFITKMLSEGWMSKEIMNDALVFVSDTAVSKVLLESGASIRKFHSEYKYGAIHYAAIRGDTTMIGFLLKNGANINQLAKEGTVSALMYASQLGNEVNSLDDKLDELGLSVNSFFYDYLGVSAEKTRQNSLASVQYLVDKGANIHFKNDNNEDALFYANSSSNHDVSEYLNELRVN